MKWGIANSKASMGGSGDAELNLAYGLTPPSDTTKIWVKCDTPSAVKVEANRQLVISSNENAKVKTQETIATTYTGEQGMGCNMLKMGEDYFFASGYYMSKVLNTNVGGGGLNYVLKLDKNGNTSFCATGVSLMSNYIIVDMQKISETQFIVLYKTGSSQSTLRWNIINTDGTLENYSTLASVVSTSNVITGQSYYNNNYYILYYSAGWKLQIDDIINLTKTNYNVDMSAIADFYGTAQNKNLIFYNNCIYINVLRGTGVGTTQNCIIKINLNDLNNLKAEFVMNLPQLDSSTKGATNSVNMLFGDKMIITNLSYASTYSDDIIIADLTNKTYEVINMPANYYRTFCCVDESTGDIEFWGGYPTNPNSTRKIKISNIYALNENTLDLYYDTLSSNNIRLLDSPTITMDAPINHAWLGDSNNIAQPVDMLKYSSGLWWGINCLGYTQLKTCSISASDVAIDYANGTTDTQTITITPTWNDATGVLTKSVATSDDTIATASLSGDSLTITAQSVGSATITISVVDEYGTTFTKTITATITDTQLV